MQLADRAAQNRKFNNLNITASKPIREASVMMTTGRFTCSGVILVAQGTATYILTAKHNLLQSTVYERKGNTPVGLVADFVSSIELSYNTPALGSIPTATARFDTGANNGNNQLLFPGRDPASWDYDLMLLKSSDPGLRTYAQTNGKSFLTGAADIKGNWAQINPASLGLKRVETQYYLQIGFGYSNDAQSTRDPNLHRLRIRHRNE